MTPPKQPIIISDFAEEQKQRITLSDKDGLHFLKLSHILYLQGDRSYTTFYLVNTPPDGKTGELVTSHNLGWYEPLLPFGFARANQRIIFNLAYLKDITPSNEILLVYKHGLIQLTKEYKGRLAEILGLWD